MFKFQRNRNAKEHSLGSTDQDRFHFVFGAVSGVAGDHETWHKERQTGKPSQVVVWSTIDNEENDYGGCIVG